MLQNARAIPACMLLVVTSISFDASASRPLITDDAHILDPQACQLEAYYRHDARGHEWGALPACNPLGSFELQLGAIRTTDRGEVSERLTLQVKTILRPAEMNDWGFGIAAGAADQLRPGASKRFGDVYLNVPVSFSFRDDRILVHGNGGIDRNHYDGATRLTWGVATEITVASRVTFLAESFDDQGKPSWQAAVRFAVVPQRVQLDSTIGGHWRGDSDGRFWSIGLRFTTAPP